MWRMFWHRSKKRYYFALTQCSIHYKEELWQHEWNYFSMHHFCEDCFWDMKTRQRHVSRTICREPLQKYWFVHNFFRRSYFWSSETLKLKKHILLSLRTDSVIPECHALWLPWQCTIVSDVVIGSSRYYRSQFVRDLDICFFYLFNR